MFGENATAVDARVMDTALGACNQSIQRVESTVRVMVQILPDMKMAVKIPIDGVRVVVEIPIEEIRVMVRILPDVKVAVRIPTDKYDGW